MPIGSGRVGGFGVKAAPGNKGPHRGLAWRTPRLSQFNAPSASRVFDASVPTYPTAFADVRASSATYFNSSGVLSTAASNTQRIDYNRATLALRGLEVEPAATNLVTTSDFTAWNQLSLFSVAAATGLDGASNAYDIVPNTTSGGHLIYLSASSYTTPDTNSSCLSVYAKSSDFSLIAVRENSGAAAIFNVATGTVTGTNNTGGWTVSNATITNVGGGWFRLSAAFTASGALSTLITFIPCDGWTSGDPYFVATIGDNVKKITLQGPQAELGATSPSSVIVSAGSTTTRAADSISFTLNASATQLTFTFDDLSTQLVTGLTGGSTYTIPTNLNRPWILYIDDNSAGVAADNVALAATEAADTAAFAVTETVNAALAATEAPDTAAIVASVGDNAALAATEAQDVALINTTESDVAVLAATEAQDTAAIVVQVKDNAALAATEALDVAAIAASVGDNAALAATEAKDVALINAFETDVAVLSATETPDVAAFIVTETDNAALVATEAADVAAVTVTVGATIAVLAATENSDVSRFSVAVTEIVIPPDPRPSHGLRRIYPAAGVPGVYGADIFGGGAPGTTPDFSSGDFSGDFARAGTPATPGSGAGIYGAAGALNKPLRRTTGPQMRRTYKYPVQLIQGGIYEKDIYGQNIYQSDS